MFTTDLANAAYGPAFRPALAQMGAMAAELTQGLRPACAVSLIDRRTGRRHKINGSPLVLFTRSPEVAAAELLDGRDAEVWEVRIDAITPAATRQSVGRK